jgi:hypothetical protein
MNVGWKRLIPLGMAVILLNAVVGMLKGVRSHTASSRWQRNLEDLTPDVRRHILFL